MSVEVICPNPQCGASQQVPLAALGRQARCRQCGEEFALVTRTAARNAPAAETIVEAPHATPSPTMRPPPPGKCPPPLRPALPSIAAAASPSRAPPISPDKQLVQTLPTHIGRFEVRSRVGAGAMGVVYRAFDPLLGRDVAVKVPHEAALADASAVARFLREPKAAAQLRHPHIVPVYDAATDQGRYYIASAYIEGRTLEESLAEGRPEFRRAAQIVLDLAEALDYAHSLGVVHRDVKSANIMLDARGDALVMDFGLARIESAADQLTHDGTLLGTPAYMAPEQAGGELGEVGPTSDQYSLGVMLYELLCGDRPFHGPPAVVIYNVLHEAPRPPRAIDPLLPRDLETICLKAMARQPAARYASCGELAADLRRWLDDQPIHARRMSTVERTLRWARKRPGLAALSAAVLLLAALSTSVAVGLQRSRADLTLAVALADDQRKRAEAEAAQAEAAIDDLNRESAARAELERELERREGDVARATREIERTRQALGVKDAQLDEQDRELGLREAAIAKAAEGKQKAVAEAEAQGQAAEQAEKERAELARTLPATATLPTRLKAVQTAIEEKRLDDAQALLDQFPEESRFWEWDYLHARADGRAAPCVYAASSRRLRHRVTSTRVNECAIKPDGKRVAIVTADSVVILDAITGRKMHTYPLSGEIHPFATGVPLKIGESECVGVVHWRGVLEIGWDGDERALRAPLGHINRVLYPHRGNVMVVELTSGYYLLVDLIRGGRPRQLADVRHSIAHVALNRSGEALLLSAEYQGRTISKAKVHNITSGSSFALPCLPIVFSGDLRFGIAEDGRVVLDPLELPEGKQAIPRDFGSPIAFGPEGKRVACRGNGRVRLIDTASADPKEWRELIVLGDGVFAGENVQFSENWRCVVSRSGDGLLQGCAW